MSYEDIAGCAAIICIHVAHRKAPILYASRSEPLESADSGWQFLCGEPGHGGPDAQVWRLDEVVSLDPSLREILDAAPDSAFERDPVTFEWYSAATNEQGEQDGDGKPDPAAS